MYVNTLVLRALMELRSIDERTVANLAHVNQRHLHGWLHQIDNDDDNQVPFDTQLEIVKLLGIHAEAPRSDKVHYWTVQEGFFSGARKIYWALETILNTFGKAEVVHFARGDDPALSTTNVVKFGLKFPTFRAMLEIKGHPLRSLRFDPANITNLSWMPDTNGVLLENNAYELLQPGLVTPSNFETQLTQGRELVQWERTKELAAGAQIRPEQITAWIAAAQAEQDRMAKLAAPSVEVPSAAGPAPQLEVPQEPVQVAPGIFTRPTADVPAAPAKSGWRMGDDGRPETRLKVVN